jgi:hypothetical protein
MANGWLTDSEVKRLYVCGKSVRSRYLTDLWKVPHILSLPADRFTWTTSPNFTPNARNCGITAGIVTVRLIAKRSVRTTSGRDYVLVIIRLMIAEISVISAWQWLPTYENVKRPQVFIPVQRTVYLVALFGMIRLPWRIYYKKKLSKVCHKI